jgi:hypothetical protein
MFGMWQILLGCVGDDPLKVLILVVGTMLVALIIEYMTKAIWYHYWSVFIHVDVDADDDVSEDADDVLEDVDDGVAGQDNMPVEAAVAAVTIAAPLRRSNRITRMMESMMTMMGGGGGGGGINPAMMQQAMAQMGDMCRYEVMELLRKL